MAMIDKGIIKKERERERERTNKHRFDLRDKKAKRCVRERERRRSCEKSVLIHCGRDEMGREKQVYSTIDR